TIRVGCSEIGQPVVVDLTIGARERRIAAFVLPAEAERRVHQRDIDPLLLHPFEPRPHVPRRGRHVTLIGWPCLRLLALPERPDVLVERAKCAEGAALDDAGLAAGDLKVFRAALVAKDPERPAPEIRGEVLLPQVRRFKDVPVYIDDLVVHIRPPLFLPCTRQGPAHAREEWRKTRA